MLFKIIIFWACIVGNNFNMCKAFKMKYLFFQYPAANSYNVHISVDILEFSIQLPFLLHLFC